jgi:hypothetical protein
MAVRSHARARARVDTAHYGFVVCKVSAAELSVSTGVGSVRKTRFKCDLVDASATWTGVCLWDEKAETLIGASAIARDESDVRCHTLTLPRTYSHVLCRCRRR